MINVEFDGIELGDAHDFSDAYIKYAEHDDGTPLTEQELEDIDSSEVYELLMDYLY